MLRFCVAYSFDDQKIKFKKRDIKELVHFKMQPFPSPFKAAGDPASPCAVDSRPLGLCRLSCPCCPVCFLQASGEI